MADETVITFAKDDTIIVEEAMATVASKLEGGAWASFVRGTDAVRVQSALVRYIRAAKKVEGGR